MAGIKGPAVFLAQFLRDTPPFNTLEYICKWFADLGYTGVQIPGWDRRVIDIDLAATSATYCDELRAQACRSRTLGHRGAGVSRGPSAGNPSRL